MASPEPIKKAQKRPKVRKLKKLKASQKLWKEEAKPAKKAQPPTGGGTCLEDISCVEALALESLQREKENHATHHLSDDDDDSDEAEEQCQTTEDAKTLVRILAVLGSSWFLDATNGPQLLVDTFAQRFTVLTQSELSRHAVFSLFQVLRHMLGLLALMKDVDTDEGFHKVSDSIQLVMQLLLKHALRHGCSGWDNTIKGKQGISTPGEVDRLLELVACYDPDLRSFWYSMACNAPTTAGHLVWKSMIELMAGRVNTIKPVLSSNVNDFITFLIAVRLIQQHISQFEVTQVSVQRLRILCANAPPSLVLAIKGAKTSTLSELRDRFGKKLGEQRLGTYLMTEAPLEECWALQSIFSGNDTEAHYDDFVEDEFVPLSQDAAQSKDTDMPDATDVADASEP